MLNIEEELIQEEGLRLTAYQDTLGNWTCGVGHLMKSDCGTVSLRQVGEWLAEDIQIARDECMKRIECWTTLNEARQYVLISMMFNLGSNRFMGFKKMLLALNNGAYAVAAAEMLDSRWAHQVKGRATKLAGIMKTGVLV